MPLRNLFLGAAAVLTLAAATGSAQAASEGEIMRMQAACVSGDRDACIRRDQAVHDHDHESEWRLHHPDWYR